MRKRLGLTLVELIIVITLIGIVLSIGGNVLLFSFRSLQNSISEFQFQSDVRFASGWATSRIRYATAVFTVPEGSFRRDNLANEWNYYGVENDTTGSSPVSRIVHYTWNPGNSDHDETEIAEHREGISYRMTFSKEKEMYNGVIWENDLLDFDILGFIRGNTTNPYMVVEGTTFAANALQAVDYGTELHRATAIAYRRDEIPGAYIGHVAMVLDVSPSMLGDMDGFDPPLNGPRRIEILRDAATDMLYELAKQSNVDVSIIPFAGRADDPHDWENVQQSVSRPPGPDNVITQIEDLVTGTFTGVFGGGTNTGDGLRRAYFQLRDHSNALVSGNSRRFVVVLIDGDTNSYSIEPTSQLTWPTVWVPEEYYFMGEGNVGFGILLIPSWASPFFENGPPVKLVGFWDFMDIAGGYVIKCGQRLIENDFAKAFVIVFSTTVTDDGIKNIGDAFSTDLTQPNMFSANNASQLAQAFQTIKNSILNDLWHLNGPGL